MNFRRWPLPDTILPKVLPLFARLPTLGILTKERPQGGRAIAFRCLDGVVARSVSPQTSPPCIPAISMRILSDIQQIDDLAGGVVSIGNFDGIHRGHQAMLGKLVEVARELSVPAVAMTFDPPPVALIAPGKVPPRLTTIARKGELMARLGIDSLLVYPTTREFLNLSPEEFFQRVIVEQLQARGMVEGQNFCFGKNRAGTSLELGHFCRDRSLRLEILPDIALAGATISSTRIRQLIAQGLLEQANDCLGHPYRLTGRVVSGAGRGRLLGFPTANLADVHTLLPLPGVYAGFSEINGEAIPAAVHVGGNPTFAEEIHKIEVHLIGKQADLYDRELSVDLLARCRDVHLFPDKEALQRQLRLDVEQVRRFVAARLPGLPDTPTLNLDETG